MSFFDLDSLSPDELECQMSHFFQGEGRRLAGFLRVVREYDKRAVFRDDGMPDMALWLTERHRIEPRLARLYVRVSRALEELPRIEEALSLGDLSLSQVGLLSLVATPETEDELIEIALRSSYSQLVAEVRRRRDLAQETLTARKARSLRFFEAEDGSEVRMSIRGPAPESMTILSELRRRVDAMPTEYRRENAIDALMFDALCEMAEASHASPRWSPRPSVVVHADLDLISGSREGSGILEGLGVASAPDAKSLGCDAAIQMVWKLSGRPVGLSSPTYTVPPRLRRVLYDRDQGCRFCGRKFWLHAHHINAWPEGPTDPDNLVLVCRWHHRLIHDHGWSIRGSPNGMLSLFDSTNREVTAA